MNFPSHLVMVLVEYLAVGKGVLGISKDGWDGWMENGCIDTCFLE